MFMLMGLHLGAAVRNDLPPGLRAFAEPIFHGSAVCRISCFRSCRRRRTGTRESVIAVSASVMAEVVKSTAKHALSFDLRANFVWDPDTNRGSTRYTFREDRDQWPPALVQ